jgi:hypothetical protein
MSEELWNEADIMERLKDWSEDEHRNFVYPIEAKSILSVLKARDEKIKSLIDHVARCDAKIIALTVPRNT